MVYLRPDRADADAHNLDTLRHCISDFAAENLLLVVEFLIMSGRKSHARPHIR